ncbi:AraC-type DNA-binding protein [Chitinophaga sp. CF118]|uniref:helix-turn-helix domain-containing protein n=1 Tax=Chitinophaga sp. CF118 TaxID=1884367 RepID=UPI0008E544E4|nr:helix-turn-helix domain-containing protein [Chitinophaga sp. CF118]SFD03149.1 AraC-type DNA-binding protein [Chitinophaga sp. CF118]
MPAVLLPQKVKIFPAIPAQYQRYVYPFSKPLFKTTPTFSRIEQVTTIPGCRVSSIINIAEEETVIRQNRKRAVIMLQVTLSGEIICSLPSSEKITLSKGEYHLLKLNAGQQQLYLQPGINEFMRFEISPALLQELLPDTFLVREILTKKGDYCTTSVPESGNVKNKVHTLINQLRSTYITDGIQQLKQHTRIKELISSAITTLPLSHKNIVMNNPHHERITRIQTYINENLHKSISLSVLAGIYYISESKLKQDFKKYLNSSVQVYLQEQRMGKALNMLQHSDQEISDIAFEVGYANVSSFTREFRKHYACTPKDIRIR